MYFMDELCTEVLIVIFLSLSVNDQLECIRVCKKWHTIIAENILYKELDFNNISNFDKAIDLFDSNEKLGHSVEILSINSCELDIFSILSMPRQFPNLKVLDWKENNRQYNERRTDISIKLPSSHVYQRALSKWRQFESLTFDLERLSFATILLESTPLVNLTYLNISFYALHVDNQFQQTTVSKIRPIVKALMKNIQNAPSLEHLTISFSVLDLEDMELLHASTPNLRKLNAYCTAISGGATKNMSISADGTSLLDNKNSVIAQDTANSVKELYIDFFATTSISIHNVTTIITDTMVKWLIYIGCKYNNANIQLKGWGKDYLAETPEFEQPMLTIISNMSKITIYHAFLYPITKPVMDAIDFKKGGLKKLYLYSNVISSVAAQLCHVYSSKQAKTIYYLRLNSSGMDVKDSILLCSIFCSLAFNFQSLTNLSMSCSVHYCAIAKIFRLIPSLLILTLDSVQIDANEAIAVVPVTECKINTLHITLSCEKRSTMYQVNQLLEFVLQSCPLLTNFTLKGDLLLFNNGILRLCFFYHENLKYITVKVKGIQYYTFAWDKGKRGLEWADYDEPLETNDTTGRKLHADISWRNEGVELNLNKAPVN